MILHVLRALFVLLMGAVGWFFLTRDPPPFGRYTWLSVASMLVVSVLVICIDILAPRRKLAIFSGTFLGLIVGLVIAWGASFVTSLVVNQIVFYFFNNPPPSEKQLEVIQACVNLGVGVVACYLAISFILQTKDDFRFIIPYVEFSKQTKGARPILLDTSVLIDGRISDIASTGVIESQLIVPRFILHELQTIADSADKLKRNRGRRGLDALQQLKSNNRIDLVQYDSSGREDISVGDADEQLMRLAKDLNGRVMTNDFKLNKVAQLRGVDVINLNDLANAMKPVVMPGERMTVRLIKVGAEPGQGVGYLDDGTMVVVEQGRGHINEEVEFTVTNTVQKSAGRMIFGRLDGNGAAVAAHAPPLHAKRKARHEQPAPETTEKA